MQQIKAVISVVGRDQKGVVAAFATYVAEHGVNILDIEQQVVHARFIMDMLVDLSELNLSLDELVPGLAGIGEKLEMQVRVSLAAHRRPRRVAVLVSKESHCLERIIADAAAPGYRGELVCVLGNHPDLAPIAEKTGLPFECRKIEKDDAGQPIPGRDKPAHFTWLMSRLEHYQPDVIVLARYMQIVPPEMVRAYPSRIINIHPSLLPHFPGAKPYHRAWEAGVRVAGCTAHFVTEDLDEGPIILQDVFHIDVGTDTAEDVRANGQRLEGRVLSNALQMFLDEKLVVVDDKVVFRPGLSQFLDR